jgi:hypothetical protein
LQAAADLELHRVSTAEEVSRCAILPHWLLFPRPPFVALSVSRLQAVLRMVHLTHLGSSLQQKGSSLQT